MTRHPAIINYSKRAGLHIRLATIAIVLLIGLTLSGCSESPRITVPDVTGKALSEAHDTLRDQGFSNITSVDKDGKNADGKEWIVLSQDPQAGDSISASTTITLTIGKDISRIATIAEKGLSLSDAKKALKDAGFTEDDYEVKSDTGKMVLMASNWIIQSVTDGDKPIINVRKESDIKAEEEAKKKAEEESKKKEEEAARQAAEEEATKKAAEEEQARQQAEAAAAEAQRQAEEQARQQALQQQQAQQNVYYANCDAARAAGAAPLYQGQPGYSTKLDRDRDGIACE